MFKNVDNVARIQLKTLKTLLNCYICDLYVPGTPFSIFTGLIE